MGVAEILVHPYAIRREEKEMSWIEDPMNDEWEIQTVGEGWMLCRPKNYIVDRRDGPYVSYACEKHFKDNYGWMPYDVNTWNNVKERAVFAEHGPGSCPKALKIPGRVLFLLDLLSSNL